MNNWEVVIGLEIHAQVKAKTKLFSRASTKFGDIPNKNANLFDMSIPGTLPMLNEFCVKQAIKTGLGINAEINKISSFDRKHYTYPDLPPGYQITQFYKPIAKNGIINITDYLGNKKPIRITSMHLEQDAGKLIVSNDKTLVDYNRAGCALMEIVSAPDISSADEAAQYVEKLRNMLIYLDTCDGNMQEGSLRADVNVSVRKIGDIKFGTRCEIKNLNSIRFLKKAIKYEVERQINLLENGEQVIQQTMLFDEDTGQTKALRSKSDAVEYLYFPDPNLPDLVLSDEMIENIKKEIIELPDAKRDRFINEYNLSEQEAGILTEDKNIANFFETSINALNKNYAKQLSNWILSELFAHLNESNISINEAKITSNHIVEIINLIDDGTISNTIAKEIFAESFATGEMPSKLVSDKGLKQVSDINILNSTIEIVLSKFNKQVQEFKDGKQELYGWLIGQIMKEMKGKGNPKLINQLLTEKLKS